MGKFTILAAEEAESSSGTDYTSEAAENKPKTIADSLDDTFTLKPVQPKRRGRQATTSPKFTAAVAENPADYNLWSRVLISSTNTVVVTWLGAECAMEIKEANMMEPPLSRMLARMPVSASQKMATFIDPMVMMIALGMWANRIIRVQREKRQTNISQAEFDRASGIVTPEPEPTSVESERQRRRGNNGRFVSASIGTDIEPPLPNTASIEVNPNGVPVAISSQIGDL